MSATSDTRWHELQPEPGIVDALDLAGIRPEFGNQNEKRRWSETFANGCAVAVAGKLRGNRELTGKRILPVNVESGTEPLTPLNSETSKRIDVTVADAVLGLEIGVSLKGLNFMDATALNYDKNLTGRLYELADEVRLVHEHLPHAFMVGVFFLPLASTSDKKTDRKPSSFASTVAKLRERTGRLDAALPAHASRCDASYVALYTIGTEVGGYPRGLVRFLNVDSAPPRRGRPAVHTTLGLDAFAADIVRKATRGTIEEWSDPERDV